jgi:hypothetical protein
MDQSVRLSKKTETEPGWFARHGLHRLSRLHSATIEPLGRHARAFTIASMFLCDSQNGPGVSAKRLQLSPALLAELALERNLCSTVATELG